MCVCRYLLELISVGCVSQTLRIRSTIAISAKVILAPGESRSHYRLCVPPCKRKAFSAGDTQSVCCLLESRASAALEGADCPCVKKKEKKETLRARSRRRSLSKEPSPAFLAVPARFAEIKAERWLRSWESQMDQVEGMKTGESLSSFFSHQIQRPLSGFGSPPCGSFPPERGLDAPPAFLRGGGRGGRR